MATFSNNNQYDNFNQSYVKNKDAYDGQAEIKKKTTTYLPKLPGMLKDPNGQALYELFIQSALWYPATGQTVSGYTGIMMRKPAEVVVSNALEPVLNTFTDDGMTANSVARNLAKNVILEYRPAVLVDYPDVSQLVSEGMSQAEAEQMGLMPYAIVYDSTQITNWRERIGGGRKKIEYVQIEEKYDISGFPYEQSLELVGKKVNRSNGQHTIMRVLELRRENGTDVYYHEVYIQLDKQAIKDNEDDYVLLSSRTPVKNGQTFDYIPIVPCSEDGLQWDLDYAMITELVDINIADYQNEALYRDNLKFLSRPTVCTKGLLLPRDENGNVQKGTTVSFGTSTVLQFDPENGEWGLLGGDASQAEALVISGENLKKMMSNVGMRSLSSDPNGVESAETAEIHRSGEHGLLTNVAVAVTQTMTRVLQIMAEWMGEDPGKQSYVISTDFIPKTIDATLLNTLWQMYISRSLPLSQLLRNMKSGEVVDSQLSEDDFKKEIKENPPIQTEPTITEPVITPEEDDIVNDSE